VENVTGQKQSEEESLHDGKSPYMAAKVGSGKRRRWFVNQQNYDYETMMTDEG